MSATVKSRPLMQARLSLASTLSSTPYRRVVCARSRAHCLLEQWRAAHPALCRGHGTFWLACSREQQVCVAHTSNTNAGLTSSK